MIRADWMDILRGALLAVLLVLVMTAAALAADLPPVDCNAVRAQVAEHGRAKAIQWALSQGYSWSDIWRIRKQCGV